MSWCTDTFSSTLLHDHTHMRCHVSYMPTYLMFFYVYSVMYPLSQNVGYSMFLSSHALLIFLLGVKEYW